MGWCPLVHRHVCLLQGNNMCSVYIFHFFRIYTYVMSPIFKPFFLFFKSPIKKKIAWAAISLCCDLSSGLRGSAARIVQEIFSAPKNCVWNGLFPESPPWKKYLGKEMGSSSPQILGQKVFRKTRMSRPPPTVSWVSFWDCRFDSNLYWGDLLASG